MAVLDNLRKLSTMEFYKNAKKIRWELTDWLFRDFGNKHNPRSVRQVIKNIDEEDQAVIDEIFQKYGKSTNMDKLFEELYRNAERNGAKSNRGAGNTGRTFQCA